MITPGSQRVKPKFCRLFSPSRCLADVSTIINGECLHNGSKGVFCCLLVCFKLFYFVTQSVIIFYSSYCSHTIVTVNSLSCAMCVNAK